MTNFADRLHTSIVKTQSFIVAGFDPILESLPECFLSLGNKKQSTEEAIFEVLVAFYEKSVVTLAGKVAAIKPNIAFFEQYGIGGLRAFERVCSIVKENKIPLIIDAKRGDIGSTAQAYSSAFLGKTKVFGKQYSWIDADAVTVNPFLGFDTIDPFVKDCKDFGKGLFVLVRTSNPGSNTIQGLHETNTRNEISEIVAAWISKNGAEFVGTCGFSGIGAVVGAPYPAVAQKLRSIMPKALLLIPGMGAQGGSATDAVAGFGRGAEGKIGGAIVNLSRGLMSTFSQPPKSVEEFCVALKDNADKYNAELIAAVDKVSALR